MVIVSQVHKHYISENIGVEQVAVIYSDDKDSSQERHATIDVGDPLCATAVDGASVLRSVDQIDDEQCR